MQSFDIIKESELSDSFRVKNVCGKFDINIKKTTEHFLGELDLDFDWKVGLIVGNSGTGKTTIARELFKGLSDKSYKYKEKSVIDDFRKGLTTDEIVKMFVSVGFSSPPSWLKPYHVLSNGEKMRVDLARALLSKDETIVFDEFTSVVDRNVAKVTSYAVSKRVRKTEKKFVAVACHDDIIDWLTPDWIFYTNNMTFEKTRGLLRRPKINIKIYKKKGLWNLFKKYHYLSNELAISSKQFVAYYNSLPIAFIAVMHTTGLINFKRVSRLVVLPDFQGVGVGKALLDVIAKVYKKEGHRFRIVTSNPALTLSFLNNKHWKLKNVGRSQSIKKNKKAAKSKFNVNRKTPSWEYYNE